MYFQGTRPETSGCGTPVSSLNELVIIPFNLPGHGGLLLPIYVFRAYLGSLDTTVSAGTTGTADTPGDLLCVPTSARPIRRGRNKAFLPRGS